MYVIYWSKQRGTLIIALIKCPIWGDFDSNSLICTYLVHLELANVDNLIPQLLGTSSEGNPSTFQQIRIAFDA